MGASIVLGQDEDGTNVETDIGIGTVSSTTNATVTLSADNSTKTTNLTDVGMEDVSIRSINGVPVTQAASIDLDDFAKQADSDNTISVVELLSVSPNTTSSLPDIISTSSSEDERLQKAEEAMEEYMESDDGGDAWLASLSEIINDDESDLNGGEDDKGNFQ